MIKLSVFGLLFTLHIVLGLQDYKKCNTSSLPTECPENWTKCSQISQKSNSPYSGLCTCIGDYEFNANYENDNDYCVYVKPVHDYIGGRPIESSSTSEAVSDTNRPNSSHHIIGGILISICLVLIFALIAIGFKKLQIKQRIRNMRMTQRNRPLYEDVMMGNDNDDPPLI